MTRVAERCASALLLGWAALVISACAADKEPEVQAQQLAEEATQRVCDLFETCCVAANFPYRDETSHGWILGRGVARLRGPSAQQLRERHVPGRERGGLSASDAPAKARAIA